MVKKLSNTNYLHDVPVEHAEANERNRKYIDRFVSENYNGLVAKFFTSRRHNKFKCFRSTR